MTYFQLKSRVFDWTVWLRTFHNRSHTTNSNFKKTRQYETFTTEWSHNNFCAAHKTGDVGLAYFSGVYSKDPRDWKGLSRGVFGKLFRDRHFPELSHFWDIPIIGLILPSFVWIPDKKSVDCFQNNHISPQVRLLKTFLGRHGFYCHLLPVLEVDQTSSIYPHILHIHLNRL